MTKNIIYRRDELDTIIELCNIGTKLKEVYFMFTKIPCQTIIWKSKKEKEEVTILKPGPKPMIKNKM